MLIRPTPNWSRIKCIAIGPMIGVVCGLICAGAIAFHRKSVWSARHQPVPINVARAVLRGNSRATIGDSNSPFALVEFGDYQCTPCIATAKTLPAVLQKYSGRLSFTFRNFPIIAAHRDARKMAVAAEAAGRQNKFWEMNRGLYGLKGRGDDRRIADLAESLHLDMVRFAADSRGAANQIVSADQSTADELKLSSTPTFILFCPGGKAYLLRGLDQVASFVK